MSVAAGMHHAIVSYKQLGDVVLLEPLTRLLAERGGDTTHVFTKRGFEPVIGLMPRAEFRAFSMTRYGELWSTHPGGKATRHALALRAQKKHLIFPWEPYARKHHRFVYDEIHRPELNDRYWARYHWEEMGGEPGAFTPPALERPPDAWRPELPGSPDRYVVIHPTAAWESKFWTPEGWAAVARRAREQSGLPLFLSCGPAANERHHAEAIAAAAGDAVTGLISGATVEPYVSLIANASAVLAVDGSACHLADAFQVPALKLFGQTFENEWHYERPHTKVIVSGPEAPQLRPPAAAIPAATVLEALDTLLEDLPDAG